jgi:Flp pilus assembly protein TadD
MYWLIDSKRGGTSMHTAWMVLLLTTVLGCSSQSSKTAGVLTVPAGTKPAVAAQLERGNALFASSDFAGAEQAFRQALLVDATSAEAHYNLAVTLDRTGNKAEAKKHYIQAANLAPGNKVIWDSPPFRAQSNGLNHDISRKSHLDPTNRGF